MNLAELSIRYKTVTYVMMVVLIIGGLLSFQNMPRLEDPEFTLKEAQVITAYPGATAEEVEREVTEIIERAAQQMGQLKRVTSRSERGRSTVSVSMKDQYGKEELPQIWDELRRKVNDAQSELPPGAQPSLVADDFGDVYGVFFGLTGDGYSYAELEAITKRLQRELLLVENVRRISLYGVQTEAIYIEIARAKLAALDISQDAIYAALSDKNLVADAGRVQVGTEYIPIHPTGEFDSLDEFGDLLIGSSNSGGLVYLRDLAEIRRGYVEPSANLLRVNSIPAVGLAISTIEGGNVVEMGEAVRQRIAELESEGIIPFGVELHVISMQSDAVTVAIDGFVMSLLQAMAIVVVVLMIFMGLRSGLLIGFVLFLTICASFVVMAYQGIILERISLGALIIALGMLVDNAIVVTEGMQVRIRAGEDRLEAAKRVVSQTMMPLLGATAIAILAFAAIGTSDDSTGEFCRSLYQVILISLSMSWVTAMTVTPLLCYVFIKPSTETAKDPYAGRIFRSYRNLLEIGLRRRWATVSLMIGLMALSMFGFGAVDQSFFPNSTRPQFMIDFWMPEGTHLDETSREAADVEAYLAKLDNVTGVKSFVGQGGTRFLLTYAAESPNTSYAQFLVDVDDYHVIDSLLSKTQTELTEKFPHARTFAKKFALGPSTAGKIQARISGPNPQVLRELSEKVLDVYRADGRLVGIHSDWRTPVKVLHPTVADVQARNNGIARADIARTMQEAFQGVRVGVYREADKLLPIISRPPASERSDVGSIRDLQIWSAAGQRMIPISQVVTGSETTFEDPVIRRRDRARTIAVKADPANELASDAFARVRPAIDAIEIPAGYTFAWGGESEDSGDANASLASKLPIFFGMMVLVTLLLFNALRQPLIIWLCVPLGIIGVTAGLLLTGQPFGFMPLLGILSLTGMLVKNAIVLIEEIEIQKRDDKPIYQAIVDSGVSRLRPVMMAASTTVLGMLPLVLDAFFVSMAVTIMFGLAFASVLTLIVVPVLYAIFFRAKAPTSA
jgi:multidrug efflux pump subunit AcrB